MTTERRLAKSELIRQLGASMGQEKASAVVRDAMVRKGFADADTLSLDQTMLVCEELSKLPGLVGTVARFAKARLILFFES